MSIIGSICAIAILGAFLGLATAEWILWSKRTKAETEKFKAEAAFYEAMAWEITEAAHE